ncbi:MAG: hypothetical protein K2X69_08475 [Silvanigrellaceae bacterium]|nr:hypothetical protein [Silvanigrellaceae bacterium]
MSLIGLAQSLDRIASREYPLLNIPIISEIKNVLFKNNKEKFLIYFDKNKARIEQYPAIYKSIIKELESNS